MYFLVKSEPNVYPFSQLLEEGATRWDGIRNALARNYLRTMVPGTGLLYYHSNIGKEIVGTAMVTSLPYPDPTLEGEHPWLALDIAPVAQFPQPVSLQNLKADPILSTMEFVRMSRLSVSRVTDAEWTRIHFLAGLSL
jgi:predicted RNA-binding protein with PUA-like domain